MTDAKIMIEIFRAFFILADKRRIEETDAPATGVEAVMRKMGINIYVDAPGAVHGDTNVGAYGLYNSACLWPVTDEMSYRDEEGEYLTWAGHRLIRASQSYDWEDHWSSCVPRREPLPGEEVFSYGDGWVEWVGLVPCNRRLPDALVEKVHLLLNEEASNLLLALKEEKEASRKEWGREQNCLLREAGCSQAAVSAWWSLRWKKEVSPEYWANLVNTTPAEVIRLGLRAHAKWALERIGAPNRGSFPRTMDVIHGLAKVHRLKPASKQAYKASIKGDVVRGVSPKKVDKDGQRIWSF
jgi:hypothetical protein